MKTLLCLHFILARTLWIRSAKSCALPLTLPLQEVVVEGFYSVVGAHKKSGGQSNKSLTERAIGDWCLPHPVRCPAMMKTIANIYPQGNPKHHLPKHRIQAFTDIRRRASTKFSLSKIIDQIASDTPRCPLVLTEEQ